MQAAEPAREAEMFEAAVHASLVVPYTTYTTHAKLVTLDLVSSYLTLRTTARALNNVCINDMYMSDPYASGACACARAGAARSVRRSAYCIPSDSQRPNFHPQSLIQCTHTPSIQDPSHILRLTQSYQAAGAWRRPRLSCSRQRRPAAARASRSAPRPRRPASAPRGAAR